MQEEQLPKVINTHWFGGIEKLPPNTVYIGRPSPYGNAYSSKSGKHTREECIALHRIDLYRLLNNDPGRLAVLRRELEGRDLACWCKHPKTIVGCHGDTYLHIFSPEKANRDYTRSVVHYLMDDLRGAIDTLSGWITHTCPADHSMWVSISLEDARLDISNVLRLCREWETPDNSLEYLIARLVVDLELAAQDTDVPMIEYRLAHAAWVAQQFAGGSRSFSPEPIRPDVPLKRKSKGDKDD